MIPSRLAGSSRKRSPGRRPKGIQAHVLRTYPFQADHRYHARYTCYANTASCGATSNSARSSGLGRVSFGTELLDNSGTALPSGIVVESA